MAGESNPGIESKQGGLPSTRQRLKTALKIIVCFCLLCFVLVAGIGYYAYKEWEQARARSAQNRWIEHQGSMPVPFEQVEIVVEDEGFPSSPPTNRDRVTSRDDLGGTNRNSERSTSDGSQNLPAGLEAAATGAPTSKEHGVALKNSGLVINEIFFHPPSSTHEPEETGLEFVELFNPGSDAIALEGYEFTKGVKFVFPSITIPSDGYLVVAANPAVFKQANRGVPLVVGGWEGRLSNSGEEIQLENSDGKKMDAVRYSDQGDWAQRGTGRNNGMGNPFQNGFRSRNSYGSGGGWAWLNSADGEGHSLELLSPAVTNQCGQNWRPSASKGGTPGRQNSNSSPDIAPVIRDVIHSPTIPTPSDTVIVSAELRDEIDTNLTAEIYWRVSGSRATGSFRKVKRVSSGGTYSGEIPRQQSGSIVEFFVRASDGNYSRTWPRETSLGQATNALYQVEAAVPVPRPGFGLYRLIMTRSDSQRFQNMSRHTNAQVNATIIVDDGAGPKVRHNCGIRYRGAGSRNHHPTPMRVNIPGDNPWHGSTRMNLNSKFSWVQFTGMKILSDAGVRTPDTRPVEVWINGDDLMGAERSSSRMTLGKAATDQQLNSASQKNGSNRDYGYYVHMEPLGGEWAKKHLPLDGGGNCYKKVRPDSDWAYRRGSVSRYLSDGWSKSSNSAAADWSDLDNFLNVMNNSSSRNDYLARVRKVANLEQWYDWLGVNAILSNGEGGLAKGIDDDYGLYRGITDQRFQLLPHDMDTILGFGDSSRITSYDRTLFDFAERSDEIDALESLFDEPAVRRRYVQNLSRLVDGTFSEERFEPLVANQLRGWIPNRELQRMVKWMNYRRAFVTSEVEDMLGSTPPKPIAHSLKFPARDHWRLPSIPTPRQKS